MVGEDMHLIFEAIKQARANAVQKPVVVPPLMITPHMSRALERNLIMPWVARGRGGRGPPENTTQMPPLWLRALLYPCGYRAQQCLWIHDVDLVRGSVVIVNHSAWSVDLGCYQLCNEESRQKFGA